MDKQTKSNVVDIKIDSGIPIPEIIRRGRAVKEKYPFSKLKLALTILNLLVNI